MSGKDPTPDIRNTPTERKMSKEIMIDRWICVALPHGTRGGGGWGLYRGGGAGGSDDAPFSRKGPLFQRNKI